MFVIKLTKMTDNSILRTDVLPEYNCNNCEHFQKKKQILITIRGESYAYECNNLVHPLEDCVMRGFEAHSDQPGHSQTLNKK
jgi:hypothetical protein